MQMPIPGTVFEGKYEICEVLGKGGFACVYRGVDVEVGRDVAIKVLTPQAGGYDAKLKSRFEREARVIAGLQDPHTITMFDFGQTPDGLLFMVFEYVRGHDLQQVLVGGALPPAIVAHVLQQLLSALGEAHERHILHRDIKPANVIVFEYMGDPWRVKLIDFGIAKPIVQPGGRDLTKLTQEGAVVGTPRYMAPEQFFGDELTPSSDIYSLGLLAFEMLVGRAAVTGDTSAALVRNAVSGPPHELPTGAQFGGIEHVIARMIEREPDRRFPNTDAVVAALNGRRQVSNEPSRLGADAGASSRSEPSRRRRTRSEALSIGAGALALFGVLAVAAALTQQESEVDAGPQATLPAELTRLDEPGSRANPLVRSSDIKIEPLNKSATRPVLPADGCGREVPWSGRRTFRVRLEFRTRTYTVYLPPGYDPDVRHRVVFVLHNALRDGNSIIHDTDFDGIAAREQLVLIAPNAIDNMKPWFGEDDVELARVALRDATQNFCLDDTHVYALGHGGGGGFAVRLRCEMPLSAIAVSANGEYVTDQVCESTPVPTLRMFGNKDKHVPANGGFGCFDFDRKAYRTADEVERLWRSRNATRGAGKKWFSHSGGTCTLWEGGAAFAHCELDGGHDWTGAKSKIDFPNCEEDPPDFPMAETSWNFFEEHGQAIERAGGEGEGERDGEPPGR